MLETVIFGVFAVIAVACGIGVVVQTHPIRSAISLIGVMGSLAVLYLTLGGEFIAATQVLVYAGAVMVLFVFVIMLLNAEPEMKAGRSWAVRILGIPLLAIFLGLISFLIQRLSPEEVRVTLGGFTKGSPRDLGELLFTDYLLPFEATSVLILVAIIGAVVLAGRETR
jgi:NADH-quinone oxidoreductase subunit J